MSTIKIVSLTVLLGLAPSCGGRGGQSGSIVAATQKLPTDQNATQS